MLTLSIVARLPLAMFSIGLLVHAQHLTGSFAAAGLVTAAYAVALGIGGPLLGRVVDRRGQTAVLLATALVVRARCSARSRCCRSGSRCRVLVALAAGHRVRDAAGRRLRADAAVATRARSRSRRRAVELTWVFGPPLALGRGRAVLDRRGAGGRGRRAARRDAGLRRAPGLARLAARRRTRGRAAASLRTPGDAHARARHARGRRRSSARSRSASPRPRDTLGSTAAAGPLLGVWGVGSLLGGLLAARAAARRASAPLVPCAAGSRCTRRLTAALLARAALEPSSSRSPPCCSSPAPRSRRRYAIVYALVERAAPAGTVTEAFAWLATAVAVGAALGAAVGGPAGRARRPDRRLRARRRGAARGAGRRLTHRHSRDAVCA